jgi:hypothetical protein
VSALSGHLDTLDRPLVAKGFPALSPFWRATFKRFLDSTRRQLVLRCGRRGGKSSSLCRLAVAVALYGEHKIPPGDVGVIAFISTSRDEANQRLRTIKAILDAIGVKYKPIDGGIEVEGRPVVFKVYAASVAGVSGFTAVLVVCDEVSKWKDADTGANPATEVLGSLRPTLATQPTARIILSSSPTGNEDAHAKAFSAGETDFQQTVFAPSWLANPSITEADTHALEPDERVWRREYAAIPQGSALGAFDPDAVANAFRPFPERLRQTGASVIAIDPAGRGSDDYSAAAVAYFTAYGDAGDRFILDDAVDGNGIVLAEKVLFRLDADGNHIPNPHWRAPTPILAFWNFQSFDSKFRAEMSAESIVKAIGVMAREAGATRVLSDQFDSYSLDALIQREGLTLRPMPWTSQVKLQAVQRVKRWLNDESVIFAQHDRLRRELLAYEERVGANGITYGGSAPDGKHFDLLSCVLTTAVGEIAGELFGSPIRKGSGFREIPRSEAGLRC